MVVEDEDDGGIWVFRNGEKCNNDDDRWIRVLKNDGRWWWIWVSHNDGTWIWWMTWVFMDDERWRWSLKKINDFKSAKIKS